VLQYAGGTRVISCFISVTLKSWSGRKLLDPTTYVYLYIQFIYGTIYFLTPVAILCTTFLNIVRLCIFSTGCAHLTWLGINNGYVPKQPETCGLYNGVVK
jgi:hypothetical protein